MIRTTDLSRKFRDAKRGDVVAVDKVTITAPSGEVFGLLGVNGAGKTTMLRMLSTIIRPTAGTAEVNGFDVATQSEKVRASIGFLSSTTSVYTRLTAREVIQYFGTLSGLEGDALRDAVEGVIERMGVGEFADRLCDKLSTGQKQRVSIARTIVHDPPVLFFDEPTTGLDVLTSQSVLEFIESQRGVGKTVVFSSHIMTEAERLCDRIAIIHQGSIRAEGTVDELKDRAGAATLERAFLKLVA